jgi:hypothetical protein
MTVDEDVHLACLIELPGLCSFCHSGSVPLAVGGMGIISHWNFIYEYTPWLSVDWSFWICEIFQKILCLL